MADNYNLERFIQAQNSVFDNVVDELRNGRKKSHWMWYIFPQLKGLGHSYTSYHFGLSGIEEAEAYLQHPVLSSRLDEVCKIILNLSVIDPKKILGEVDALKLRSSMTLFDMVCPNNLFEKVINTFFGENRCQKTIDLIHHKESTI